MVIYLHTFLFKCPEHLRDLNKEYHKNPSNIERYFVQLSNNNLKTAQHNLTTFLKLLILQTIGSNLNKPTFDSPRHKTLTLQIQDYSFCFKEALTTVNKILIFKGYKTSVGTNSEGLFLHILRL